MLINFEKVGIKKTPERHSVLKAMKDKIDSDQCSLDELLEIIKAYPDQLKSKVSQQMTTLALQKLKPITEEY